MPVTPAWSDSMAKSFLNVLPTINVHELDCSIPLQSHGTSTTSWMNQLATVHDQETMGGARLWREDARLGLLDPLTPTALLT